MLSDDPTYLAGGLGLIAAGLLVATYFTQQGRYLVHALVALGLAATVLVVEHFWVTDSERIERVIYDLRDAVQASDPDRVLAHLTPDVQYIQEGSTTSDEGTRAYIRSILSNAKFDFVRIGQLQAEAHPRSRTGSARFRVFASGSFQSSMIQYNFGTVNSDWSLGFEEASPGVWKVNRISPTRISRDMPGPSGSGDSGRRRGPLPNFKLPESLSPPSS